MSIKILTNGEKYTLNPLGLDDNRCITYEMFTIKPTSNKPLIYVSDDTEDGAVGWYLSKTYSVSNIPENSIQIYNESYNNIPDSYNYLICEVTNTSTSIYEYGLIVNGNEMGYDSIISYDTKYFCVNLTNYLNSSQIDIILEQR